MSSIVFKNITKSYSSEYGLIDFDCEINSGEFITVIGPSGAGKSTFLKLIAGLLTPDCGELYIADELVNDKPAAKRDIAMVFQEYALYPNYNVYENVGAYLKFKREDESIIREKVMYALSLFDISSLANRRIKELSGGQKQKVALAKLFVRDPSVILFDEPLSNIDEVHKVEYRQNIIRLKELLPNTTFVYVTHNLGEALTLGERVLVIENGRFVSLSTPADLINFPSRYFLVEMLNNCETKPLNISVDKLDEFYLLSIKNKENIHKIILNNKKYLAFDDKDFLIGGAKSQIILEGILDKGIITFKDFSVKLNEEMRLRLLLKSGKVSVVFDINKFHTEKFREDIELKFKFIKNEGIYNLLEIDSEQFIIHHSFDKWNLPLYYDINDVKIYTLDWKKVLANYKIYPNVLYTNNRGNKIFVNKDVVENNNIKNNQLIIPMDGIKGLSKKKGINKIIVNIISEEIIDDESKLVYASVKNAEHYICFYLNRNIIIDYKTKNYVILND